MKLALIALALSVVTAAPVMADELSNDDAYVLVNLKIEKLLHVALRMNTRIQELEARVSELEKKEKSSAAPEQEKEITITLPPAIDLPTCTGY